MTVVIVAPHDNSNAMDNIIQLITKFRGSATNVSTHASLNARRIILSTVDNRLLAHYHSTHRIRQSFLFLHDHRLPIQTG